MLDVHFSTRLAPALLFMPILCGCGGDGGGNVASTPAPASPTYATLASGTGTLNASSALLNFSRPASTSAPSYSASASDLTISYNASTQTYTISANMGGSSGQPTTASYGPAQVDTSQGLPNSYSASTVANGVTTLSTLRLNLASTIALTYSDVGAWYTGATQADGSQNFNTVYFSYGIRTQASDMPRTGSATYGLSLVGEGPGVPVQGSGNIAANFGSGIVSVSLTPEYVYGPQRIGSLGPITGTGTISSSTASFMSSISSSAYVGTANGNFYGPQAAEVGGNFVITSSTSGALIAVGAFSGKKN